MPSDSCPEDKVALASVLIFFLLRYQEIDGHEQCEDLCCKTCGPDAVQVEEIWQDQDSQHFEEQGSQERDDCGYAAVVKRSEECGSEDRKSHDHIGETMERESFFCQC